MIAMRNKLIISSIFIVMLTGCNKMGVQGIVNRNLGNWAEINLPENCVPAQIASSSDAGVVVLCTDGRLFH